MTKIEKSFSIAEANLGKSVVRINPQVFAEVSEKAEHVFTFGIKNTAALSHNLIDKLRKHPEFLWLTVDKMTDLGRSVDTDIINPLTYRLMTGSTSGGCVNILKGINDLCIGTDGGGSILAPALSTNLYSFIGKGCGLALDTNSRSTEGLAFLPSAGIISSAFDILKKSAGILCDLNFEESDESKIRLIIPERDNLILPDGTDAHCKVKSALENFPAEVEVKEFRFESPFDRKVTTTEINQLFANGENDIILAWEGPIDVFGYDETIPRAFSGSAVRELTGAHGKALLKSANICGCSALTVPGDELAAGFVIICAPGVAKAQMGFRLAEKLSEVYKRPEMFEHYFIRREKFSQQCTYM